MDREAAVDRLERIVDVVDEELMPVPVRELWVYGDVALGLDPIRRLNVYLTKDVLLRGDAPDREPAFREEFGVKGIGRTVRAEWAEAHPHSIRANENGYVAPERCLAAHLLRDDEPVHLEVCNTGFEGNVTQRLRGARTHRSYADLLDPRGVCLWIDGERSGTAFEKLRRGDFVFPTLPEALGMLGLEDDEAATAADALRDYHDGQSGPTVRGDVV